MDARSRRGREMSPSRARVAMRPRDQKPQFRKVQVVYYLTRNGLLEHPHFMEVSLLANHQLRLRDVVERLTALRGKGMPSMYSWSCKRTYKNGYVWNDLSENEVIYPAEGAEYVLKGSEIINSSAAVGREPVHVHSKRITTVTATATRNEEQELRCSRYDERVGFEVDAEEEEECELGDEEKASYTSSTTPRSRCSRGVSTDELDEERDDSANKLPRDADDPDSPPAPTSTLTKTAEKGGEGGGNAAIHSEDGDPAGAAPSRSNSVLLQLIACGGNLAVPKTKAAPPGVARSGSKDLHRGVLCRSAAKATVEAERDDEAAAMIRCMSENPRFGNVQSEEKEYFSGSIVESMSEDRVGAGQLKKSNSFNEERSSKAEVGDPVKEEKREKSSAKGKCIPRKMSMSSRSNRKMV